MASNPPPADLSPLRIPVVREDLSAERRRARDEETASGLGGVVALVGVLLVLVMGATLFGTVLTVFGVAASSGGGGFSLVVLGSAAIPLLVVAVAVLGVVRLLRGSRDQWERRVRLRRLAAANGWTYQPRALPEGLPGAVFDLGRDRALLDAIRIPQGDGAILVANLRYTVGSGKNRRTRVWGVLGIPLAAPVPHVVLDARANDGLLGMSSLPVRFHRDQVLSLEGDLDRHFRVYCPEGYERDALYLLTPDVLAALVDEAGSFDVELVDRWAFAYSPLGFPLADEATWRRVLSVAGAVQGEAADQASRYTDERAAVASPVHRGGDVPFAPQETTRSQVAPTGRRLRRGIPLAATAVAAVFVLWGWFANVIFAQR